MKIPFPALVLGLFLSGTLAYGQLREARVTQIIKEVNLLPSQQAPRPAVVNDEVRGDTAVRTGVESRTELTFADLTIARLGANTIFSFDQGSRTVDLQDGALLLRVPKGSGGAKISTAAVTAAITGTTIMAEYHPGRLYKFIMLEGTARICRVREDENEPRQIAARDQDRDRRVEECIDLGPGQMLVGVPGRPLGDPFTIDLEAIGETALLLEGFGPLGSEDEMQAAIAAQQTAVPVSNPPDPLDTRDLVPESSPTPSPSPSPSPSPTPSPSPSPSPSPTPSPSPSPSPSPTPQPTPQKFGTPPVITSTNLSTIDGGTVIQTDPTITRNGETGEGRIYRGPAEDGAFSAWAFTATSAFDMASGFDQHFSNPANLQIAGFKFLLLTLAGNPVIDTSNDGATKLALISVGNLTDDLGGGLTPFGDRLYTFVGLDTLLLATQAGSILLNGGTFSGIDQLYFYARGATSDLLMGANVVGTSLGIFQAERDVQINGNLELGSFFSYAGRDFLEGNGQIIAGLIDIEAGNDINFALTRFAVGDASGQIVDLFAGNAINVDIRDNQSVFTRAGSIRLEGGTIRFFDGGGDVPAGFFEINFEVNTTVQFIAGEGGFLAGSVFFNHFAATNPFDITSAGEIVLGGIIGVDNMTAGTSFTAFDLVITQTLTAGTFVDVSGDLTALSFVDAGSTINVGGTLNAPLVIAGGDVTADTVQVLNLQAPMGVLTAGAGGIIAFINGEGAAAQHTFHVDSIVSPNGIDFSGNQFNGLNGDFSGGRLTIFATSLRWDAEIGIGATNFNGADFSMSNPLGGSGGILIANATGDIFVGENISATTGLNDPNNLNAFSGNGGQVTLNAGGMLNVNSTIIVSSNEEPFPPQGPSPQPYRRSASGGNITLHSGIPSGTAITLSETSRLYSFLSHLAPGPGGTISVTSNGGDIFANGEIIADRGTIIISNRPSAPAQPGGGSVISIDGNFAVLAAETIDIRSSGDVLLGLNSGFAPLFGVTILVSADNNIVGSNFDSSFGKGGAVPVQNSSGDVNFSAAGSIQFSSFFAARENAGRSTGLNLTLDAGSTLTISNTLRLETDATGLMDGGIITVRSGGDMSLGFVQLDTGSSGLTGNGANILVEAGGNLSSGVFNASVFLFDATVQNGGNIMFNVMQDANFFDIEGEGGFDGLRLEIFAFGDTTIASGANITGMIGGNFTGSELRATNSTLGSVTSGGNIDFTIGGNLNASALVQLIIQGSAALAQNAPSGGIGTGPSIHLGAANITVGNPDVFGNFFAYINDATFGPPLGQTGSVLIESTGMIDVFGTLSVLGTVQANGAIFADTLASTNVLSLASIEAGFGGIRRFGLAIFGAPVEVEHILTAPSISSFGGINFNGLDAEGDFAMATDGGLLTLNVGSILFSNPSATDGNAGLIQGSVTLNGGAGSGVAGFEAGNGGTLTVNASGFITVNSAIEATTGDAQNNAPAGAGGTVTLNSTADTVTVNSRIQVSNADGPQPTPNPPPRRRSNSGGNINISSGKAGTSTARAVAVNIGNSGQLLALLDAAATGPGGRINIVATGANSDVNMNGRAEATRGEIAIRHQGDGGRINIGSIPTGSPGGFTPNMSADIIKAGAFGANGQLNIGNSSISAETLIRLYATGSNGQLNFVANTTLSGGSRIDLAAGTITIQPNVIVNIIGDAGPANVYTNNPNYSGFGGTNPNNGTFGGNGANQPQPFANRPGFDDPPPPVPPGGNGGF